MTKKYYVPNRSFSPYTVFAKQALIFVFSAVVIFIAIRLAVDNEFKWNALPMIIGFFGLYGLVSALMDVIRETSVRVAYLMGNWGIREIFFRVLEVSFFIVKTAIEGFVIFAACYLLIPDLAVMWIGIAYFGSTMNKEFNLI